MVIPQPSPSAEDEQDKLKAQQAHNLRQLREQMPALLDGIDIQAMFLKARFDSYIKQGFTEDHALYLLCNIKLT